jgi:hypothetical protein
LQRPCVQWLTDARMPSTWVLMFSSSSHPMEVIAIFVFSHPTEVIAVSIFS